MDSRSLRLVVVREVGAVEVVVVRQVRQVGVAEGSRLISQRWPRGREISVWRTETLAILQARQGLPGE